MTTHTAIASTAKGQFDAIQRVLLKVAYASMVAFDTYITDVGLVVVEYPVILGVNAAGTVAEIGSGVESLAVGDRVTAFQPYGQGRKDGPKGTMQEFVILPTFQCAKVPDSIALESAATVPDNFITSFYTLFDQLSLPVPTAFPAPTPPPNHAIPILVYGAGSTTGQYALQLLHAAGYTNVLATASPKHHAFLRTLGATHVFDYASATLTADVARAVGGDGKVALALDAITAEGTLARIAEAPMHWEVPAERNPFPASVTIKYVRTFTYAENAYLKDSLMPKILPELLASGLIQPNRVRLLDQGTFKERVSTGLDLLRNNRISGEKVVVKVA
ncbi:chaperonin 10-like protein [Mycena olivaceomarginata]|nr:chaperonin 10-like protein [Mycena olivaceomarginata]